MTLAARALRRERRCEHRALARNFAPHFGFLLNSQTAAAKFSAPCNTRALGWPLLANATIAASTSSQLNETLA